MAKQMARLDRVRSDRRQGERWVVWGYRKEDRVQPLIN